MARGITENIWPKLVLFYRECWRVLRVTRKPSNQEFKAIVKVSALGIGVIGALGFILHILRQMLGI